MAELVIKLVNGELAGKTAQSIAKEINAAGTAARKAEVGTKAWIDAHERLNKAKALQEDLRKQVNATTAASDKLKEAWNKLPGAQYFNQIGDSIGLVKGSVGGLTSGFKILKVAIAATGLGLLLVLAGSLVTYFSKFQSGIDLVSETFAGLKAVVNEVIGRLGTFAQGLFEIVSGNFSKGFETMSKSVDGLGESIKAAFNEGRDIERATKALERFARTQQVVSAQLTAQAEQDKAIADDATRSFAEREDAAARARKASADAARIAIDLARRELDVVNRQVAQAEKQGLINDDLAQKQADAQVKMIEAEKNLTQVMLENEKVRRELKQDRLERDLDILIDGFDNVKTVNEKILADESRTFDERARMLEDIRDLAEGSFNEQVATIQQFTGQQIDAMDLLNTADAKQLNNKIRSLGLSEIIEGRLLEMIRERRLALSDFAEFERALNDARAKEEEAKRKESAEKEIALQKKIEDLTIEAMEDGLEKEIAKINADTERKIEALTGSAEQIREQEVLLEEIRNAEIQAVKDKNAAAADAKELERLEKKAKEKEKLTAAELNLANSFIDSYIDGINRQNAAGDERLLRIKEQHGEESAAYQKALKENEELRKENAVKQKRAEKIGLTINLAAELSSIWKNAAAFGPAGTIIGALQTAAALLRYRSNMKRIDSQKYEKGGLLKGPRHSEGGIPIEAEGGEFIFSRKAVAGIGVETLSRINAHYNRKFAMGGPVNPFPDRAPVASPASTMQIPRSVTRGGSIEILAEKLDALIAAQDRRMDRVRVINVVTDTEQGIKTINRIRSDADV